LRPASPKIARVKWTEGEVQAVECLFCKQEALSSNPVPPNRRKKKGEQENRKTKEF
jgi:hypothetical protein